MIAAAWYKGHSSDILNCKFFYRSKYHWPAIVDDTLKDKKATEFSAFAAVA